MGNEWEAQASKRSLLCDLYTVRVGRMIMKMDLLLLDKLEEGTELFFCICGFSVAISSR